MNIKQLLAGFVFAAVVAVPCAQADVTTVTLTDPTVAVSALINPSTGAPGFGSTSWQNNGTSTKSELYIPVSELFPEETSPVTIDDVASISYWTNIPGTGGSPNWTLEIYTATTGTNDEASWYGTRLNAEPYFTSTTVASNTWNQWSTGGSNALLFYDAGRNGGVYGTYTDPTLAEIQAGLVTWNGSGENGTSDNYGQDVISMFSLQTGSAWTNGFTGSVDGLTVTLTDGNVGKLDLGGPVPEPSAVILFGSFAGFLGLVSLRRKRAKGAR
jgi:hypothetical protein